MAKNKDISYLFILNVGIFKPMLYDNCRILFRCLVQRSDTASDVYSKFLGSILGIVGLRVNGFDLSWDSDFLCAV